MGVRNKTQLAVGLDAGCSRTRCVICAIEDGRLRFLGYGETASAGWIKGRISDTVALSESMRVAIREAERSAQQLVDSCVAGMGGTTVQSGYARAVYEFGHAREIQQDDVTYVIDQAARVRLEADRMLLHVFPRDFVLDGRAGYRNPRRSTCARLEANVLAVTASSHEHDSLVDAIHQAHLAVEETVFEPIAAAYAAIIPQDRARGVAVIDLGMHSTDIVIFDGDALMLAAPLPVWSDHMTRDVAWVLKCPYEDAEGMKKEYGSANAAATAENSYVQLPPAEGRAPREVSRKELNEIIEARAVEMFRYAKAEISKAGMDQSLLEGVVLCGGGSMLNGICDVAEDIIGCSSRNGLAVGIKDWPEELDNPVWTTAAGLAMYSARLKFRVQTKRRAPGLVGMVRG
ncbi:MAG: cell division protein FtsA [Acidobacteria bacterium]|nr:cell division protein FtsA [Acidobacteriota bacterium]